MNIFRAAMMVLPLGCWCGAAASAAPWVLLSQETRRQECAPAGCRMVKATCRASGTLVGRTAQGKLLALSCAHGWRDDQPATLFIRPEQTARGTCLALSREADLSLWSADWPEEVDVVRVADDPPPAGTRVEVLGFAGAEIVPRRRPARVCGYQGRDLLLDATFVPGESGGAVLADGLLVGVIWGTSHVQGRAVSLRVVQNFLLQALGGRPVLPGSARRGGHDGGPASANAAPAPSAGQGAPAAAGKDPPAARGGNAAGSGQRLAERSAGSPALPREPPGGHAPAPHFWSLLLPALGVGGPLGAGAALAGWLLSRALATAAASLGAAHQRLPPPGGQARPPPAREGPFAVAVDSPAPPQQVATETHFQPYERDTFQQAHCWAKEQFARKYPGAVEMLEALDSLIRQYLASKGNLHAISK